MNNDKTVLERHAQRARLGRRRLHPLIAILGKHENGGEFFRCSSRNDAFKDDAAAEAFS